MGMAPPIIGRVPMNKTKTEAKFDAVHNEGGEGYNPIRANASEAIAKFEAEYAAGADERSALFAAEWTLEITQGRRAAWNAFARANMTKQGLRVDIANSQQKAQGWRIDDLRAAIKLHNL